jgi:mRNA interferase HigB
MRLYERRTVVQFSRRYPDAQHPLLAWANEIEAAHYENPAQLRQRYRSADFVGDKVIFNIGGNKYRLVARVLYANPRTKPPLNGTVFIVFLGTHEQYDDVEVEEL